MSGPGHGRPVGALLLVLFLTSSLSGTVQGGGNEARDLGPDIAVLDIWAEENMTVRCNITNLGGPFTGFFVLNLTANGAFIGGRTVGWNDLKGSLVVTFDEKPIWTGPKLRISVNIYDPQQVLDDTNATNDERTEVWERELPDLVVRSLYRGPDEGNVVSLIENIGPIGTKDLFYVALFLEGISEPWEMVFDPLPPGATLKVPFKWKWDRTKDPVINISVKVDMAQYLDELDEDNNWYNVTWRARPTLRFISGPEVKGVGTNNATITWKTSVPTTARLEYGTSMRRSISLPSGRASSVTGSINVKALSELTQYMFKVICTDPEGRTLESDVGNFMTKRPSGISSSTGEFTGSLFFNRTKGAVIPFKVTNTVGVSKMMIYLDGAHVKTVAGGREKAFTKGIMLGPEVLTRYMSSKSELLIRIDVHDLAGNKDSFTSFVTLGTSILSQYPRIELTPIPGTESGIIGLSARVRDPKGITDVTWKIDGVVLRRQVPVLTDKTFFFASFDWDSTRHPDGRRTVTLEANNTEGNTTRMSIFVNVDNFLCTGDPDIGIRRDNLIRSRSVVTVRLHVGNWGTEAAVNVRVQDLIKGYVPIESGHGSGMYTSDGRIWTVKREIPRIGPGETVTVEYKCIPALLSKENDHIIGLALNHPDTPAFDTVSTVCDYDRADREVSYQWARDLPAFQFSDGDLPETGAERAVAYANYMVLTDPNLLVDQLGETSASNLIIKAAELAAKKYGLMGFIVYSRWTDPYPRPSDILAKITEWSSLMNPLFQTVGYLAILGEDVVIPTWSYEDVIEFRDHGWQDVPLSDHGYSDLDGDGLPDLAVGRFIGRTYDELRAPIQTSLDVMNGVKANQNDGKALLISGAGNGVKSFKDHLRVLADDISVEMDSCTRIDKSNYLPILDTTQDFDGRGNWFTTGDVDGDGKDEIVLYSRGDGGIKIFNDDGTSSKIPMVVGSSEVMICGDVVGGPSDEILIFYWNYDHTRVRALDALGNEVDNKPVPWDVGSPVCMADQDGDGKDDVIFASIEDDEVWIYDHDRTFSVRFDVPDVQPGQRVGAGDLDDDGDLDIVIADHQNDLLRVFLAPGWDELDIPVADLEADDGFAVGHFSGKSPAEAAVLRRDTGGHLQVCWIEDDGTGTWVPKTEKKFLTDCRSKCAAAIGDFVGDGGMMDIMFCTEGGPGTLQVLDNQGVTGRFEAAVRSELVDVDLLVFSDHGGQDSWSGLMDQSDVPSWNMNTWTHRPVIYAAACSTGDYGSGPDSMAMACLRNGAGAYIGATRSSQISENNLAMQFLNDYVAGISIGMALRNYERRLLAGDLGINARLANKWAYEYQLFGDPAFGTYAGIARSMVQVAAVRSSNIHEITVPEPVVLGAEVGVEVLIPGGNRLTIDGRPMIPFKTLTFTLPPGTVAHGVTLVNDGEWAYHEGLEMAPFYSPQWAQEGQLRGRAAGDEDPDDVWYPSNPLTWNVIGPGGPEPSLVVNIFPFQFNEGASLGRSCRNWTVSYETKRTAVLLAEVEGPSGPVLPGAFANLSMSLMPFDGGGTAALSIEVRAMGSSTVHELLSDVMDINTTTQLEIAWDTTGKGTGAFEFVIELRDIEGRTLSQRTVPYQLGRSWVEINGLSSVPSAFSNGTVIDVTCWYRNNGDMVHKGNATFELLAENGTVVDGHTIWLAIGPELNRTLSASLRVPVLEDEVLRVRASFKANDHWSASVLMVPRVGHVFPVPEELSLVLDPTLSSTNITEEDVVWFNGSVSRSDGLPMTDIPVGARTTDGLINGSTRTDGRGNFSFMVTGLPPGLQTIMLGARGGTLEVWRTYSIMVNARLPDDNGTDDNTTDDDDDNVTDDDDEPPPDDDDTAPDDDDEPQPPIDDEDPWYSGYAVACLLAAIVLVILIAMITVYLLIVKARGGDLEE